MLADRPVSTDTQSNRQPFAGRLYVIVLDDLDVSVDADGAGQEVGAKSSSSKYMGANDIAAVLHTSGRTDAAQEFTSNKQLLNAAIDKFVGRRMRSLTIERLDSYYQRLSHALRPSRRQRAPTEPRRRPIPADTARMEPTDFERGYPRRRRARHAEDTRRSFSSASAGAGRPSCSSARGSTIPITDSFGGHSATDVIRATQDAITMAARANVNYYTIDPRGLVGMTNEFMEMAGRRLARTGGRAGNAHAGHECRHHRHHWAARADVQRANRADERA